jgi:hypothetical protein
MTLFTPRISASPAVRAITTNIRFDSSLVKQKSRGRDLCFHPARPAIPGLGSGVGHAGRRK